MKEIFSIISGLIILAGAPPYLRDIIKGKTKPERATWFIWSALGIIAFTSQAALHGGWSLVFLGLDGLGSITVFLLSLKYGVGGWTKLDKLALVIAAAGAIVAVGARQPVIALSGAVLADLSGMVLTIRKTYNDPASETSITWFFIGTSALLAVFALPTFSAGLLIYPVYLSVGNYLVLLAQLAGFRALSRRHKSL